MQFQQSSTVEEENEEKNPEPAVEEKNDVLEPSGELLSARQENIVKTTMFADTQQTKKSDKNHGASSKEKNATLKIMIHNETYFKYILEKFEFNYENLKKSVFYKKLEDKKKLTC